MSKHEKNGWIAGQIPNALVFECPSLLWRGGLNPVPFLQRLSGCGRLWSPLSVKGEAVHIG